MGTPINLHFGLFSISCKIEKSFTYMDIYFCRLMLTASYSGGVVYVWMREVFCSRRTRFVMHVIRCLEVTGNGCDFVAIDLQIVGL